MGIVHVGALMEFEIEGHKVAGQFDSVMFMRQVGDRDFRYFDSFGRFSVALD